MLLVVAGSCARKSTPTGKLRISLGAVEGGPTVNGVYIWGHNKTFGLTFGAHIPGNGRETNLPLKPGVWNFKVIAWDGPNMFEGVTRCGGHGDISFQGGDVDVPIHLTPNCGHPFAAGPDAQYLHTANAYPNQLKPLRLHTCRSLKAVTDGDGLCDHAYAGETQSFRIVLPSYLPRPEWEIGPYAPDSLKSACINIGAAGASTNLRIPVGNGIPESPRVYIEAFPEPGCGGTAIVKHYPVGLLGAQPPQGTLFSSVLHSVFFMKQGVNQGLDDLSIFGNGADGHGSGAGLGVDPILVDSETYTNTAGETRTWSARRRIVGTIPQASSTRLGLAQAFTDNLDFKVGDEVMWHVAVANMDDACDGNTSAPDHLTGGSYGFAHVTAIYGSIAQIEIDHLFPNGVDSDGLFGSTSGNLVKANAFGAKQCVMQLIRVPNFQKLTVTGNLTLTASGFSLGPAASLTSGIGGILAIRVKDRIVISPGQNLTVDMTGKGYPDNDSTANATYMRGVSPSGFTQTQCSGNGGVPRDCHLPNSMGGGVGSGGFNLGGGGGGHIGSGGNGQDNNGEMFGMGGLTVADFPSGPRYFPNFVMMGAAGGHGSTDGIVTIPQSGGNGGGIIFISAREILGPTASASLTASGVNGGLTTGGSVLNNGAGGGAGGSIILRTQFSDLQTIDSYVVGGPGVNGVTAGCGGGGGGGGRAFIQSCLSLTGLNAPIVAGGIKGTGATCLGALADPGQPGSATVNTNATHSFCP
ncbi:MAG: hypothetical protein A2X86_02655 [Bdellovibrionales bacterium GWA2_49_15]|nr:MAG: hypothetical protein A2X86_02655 [Bdellovibrionales bacterium GWA2_49_15]HAZ14162.1 hypothetical protein [Bdellovibrionales bacterium]